MKKILCVHFSLLAGPFKQIRVGGGHKAAVSHLKMPLKSIVTQNFCLNEQKCIFELRRKVQTITDISNNTIFKLFGIPFQSCPL
jgi:hypothetical protein